jgi:carbamoyltransferase
VSEIKLMLNRKYNIRFDRMIQYDHHLAHAAYAYYTSPFKGKPAIILTADGEGDLLSSSVNVTDGMKIVRVCGSPATASFGYLYMETTAYLGKERNQDENEVMNQASLNYFKQNNFYKGLIYQDTVNPLIFKSKFDTRLTKIFLDHKAHKLNSKQLADDIQIFLENSLIRWVKDSVKITRITNVCFGGGVGLNIKAMKQISNLTEVNKYYVPDNPGDATLAVGAVYLAYYDLIAKNGLKRSM